MFYSDKITVQTLTRGWYVANAEILSQFTLERAGDEMPGK